MDLFNDDNIAFNIIEHFCQSKRPEFHTTRLLNKSWYRAYKLFISIFKYENLSIAKRLCNYLLRCDMMSAFLSYNFPCKFMMAHGAKYAARYNHMYLCIGPLALEYAVQYDRVNFVENYFKVTYAEIGKKRYIHVAVSYNSLKCFELLVRNETHNPQMTIKTCQNITAHIVKNGALNMFRIWHEYLDDISIYDVLEHVNFSTTDPVYARHTVKILKKLHVNGIIYLVDKYITRVVFKSCNAMMNAIQGTYLYRLDRVFKKNKVPVFPGSEATLCANLIYLHSQKALACTHPIHAEKINAYAWIHAPHLGDIINY
jgi:hypothetical protein